VSTYVDHWGYQQSLATRTVHTDTPSAKVTYKSDDGSKKFSVIVRQKPNPIGFAARLPGDPPHQHPLDAQRKSRYR
jgi:hypothetical protein